MMPPSEAGRAVQRLDRFVRFVSISVKVFRAPIDDADRYEERVHKAFSPRDGETYVSLWRITSDADRDLVLATHAAAPHRQKLPGEGVRWIEIDREVIEASGLDARPYPSDVPYSCLAPLHFGIDTSPEGTSRLAEMLASAIHRAAEAGADPSTSSVLDPMAFADTKKGPSLTSLVAEEASRCTPGDLAHAPEWVPRTGTARG